MNERLTTYLRGLGKSLGVEFYYVGGCVRDDLLGIETADIDLMVRGLPQDVLMETLGWYGKVEKTGAVFGVIRFFPSDRKFPMLEISLPRKEVSLGFGHQDFEVEFDHTLSVEDDLLRRDFTINAMARDMDGNLIDPLNGQADLDDELIRVLTNTSAADDPLRILRAVRFMARLGFNTEPDTDRQLREAAPLLQHVSAERMQYELLKMVMEPHVDKALRYMEQIGALAVVLPELQDCVGCEQNKYHSFDVFEHIIRVVRDTPTSNPYVKLAALLHDIAKPPTKWIGDDGETHFYDPEPGQEFQMEPQVSGNHEIVGAKMARVIMNRLKFSNTHTDFVAKLVREHMFIQGKGLGRRAGRRLLARLANMPGHIEENVNALFDLREGDTRGGKVNIDPTETIRINRVFQKIILEELEKESAFKVTDLDVDGHDMMAIGLDGPEIGRMLRHLLDRVIEDDELNNRESLLAIVEAELESLLDPTWS